MKLFQLAYACRIYGSLTGFDSGYYTFLDKTGGKLDFKEPTHMKELLVWLNSWGCRQFAIEYHSFAGESILAWVEEWESGLPDDSTTPDSLSKKDIQGVGDAYADLSKHLASKRTRDSNLHDVKIEPTGAAKILFAARPKLFPPWDDPIRVKFGFDGTCDSYCHYLNQVYAKIKELCNEAAELGISAERIPQEVGRPRSTLPKLIDEYNWVRVTKPFVPPDQDDIAKWYTWSRQR